MLRDSNDAFSLSENDFRKMFRLSRCAARDLLDEILSNNPALNNTLRYSHAMQFHHRYLATLYFLGHGSYQKPTAENRIFCQSQASMSRSLNIVLAEIMKLARKYIKFPRSEYDVIRAKMRFVEKFNMPGIVAAIDGTHVSIIQPSERENGYLYFNRKHFYSINVLAACNADMEFVFVNAKYPGSVHDSAIWQMSKLKSLVNDNGPMFLLGDSGFPSGRNMLTPVLQETPNSKEERYNIAHKKARNIIERSFGVLK